ncbi:MAG: pitrilysin family protein, partial [Candidatus Dojkabacteria bacterium]
KNEIEEIKTDMIQVHRYAFEYAKNIGFSLGMEEVLGDYRKFINYQSSLLKISEQDINRLVNETYKIEKLGIFALLSDKSKIQFQPLMEKVLERSQTASISGSSLTWDAHKKQEEKKYEDYRSTYLNSGVKLLLKKVVGKPTVGISAAFKTSQLNEHPDNRGINYLTSILFLYGNDKRTYNQLIEFCSQLGILISVSASDEVTLIKIKCFSESLITGLQLLADIVTTPLFPHEHFLNIKKTLISNIDRMKDYPNQYATYLWKKQVFGNQSNLLDREGTKTTIRNLTRKKIINWYYDHYKLPEMVLSIVGDFSFEVIIRSCNKIFRQVADTSSANRTAKIIAAQPLITEDKVNHWPNYFIHSQPKKYKKNVIPANIGGIVHVGGYCSPSIATKKNTAFQVLGQILGGDINSRLYTELREKRGLAYNVGFATNTLHDLGYYAAYAIVDKKTTNETIHLIINSFQEIISDGVGEEELIVAKNGIRGQRLLAEESVSSQANTLATLDCLGYDYDFYLKREERLQNITCEDIQHVAAEFLQKDKLYIHILV